MLGGAFTGHLPDRASEQRAPVRHLVRIALLHLGFDQTRNAAARMSRNDVDNEASVPAGCRNVRWAKLVGGHRESRSVGFENRTRTTHPTGRRLLTSREETHPVGFASTREFGELRPAPLAIGQHVEPKATSGATLAGRACSPGALADQPVGQAPGRFSGRSVLVERVADTMTGEDTLRRQSTDSVSRKVESLTSRWRRATRQPRLPSAPCIRRPP